MAYTEFYITTTGHNANSGSTESDTPSVISTNGDWSTSTYRFTAAGGATPFLGVSVGEWASVHNDNATFTQFTGQITAVDPSGTYIDISSTIKMGSAPTTSSTQRSVRIGGAWGRTSGSADSSILGTVFASGTVVIPTRINMKAGTYVNTTAGRQIALSGTAANPMWMRGYKNTIGDMDNQDYPRVAGTDLPLMTFTTGNMTVSASHILVSGICVTGARVGGGGCITSNGANVHYDRCQLENTAVNSQGIALSWSSGNGAATRCYFKSTTTSNRTVVSFVNSNAYKGCIFEGGIAGLDVAGSSASMVADHCVFINNASYGILTSSTVCQVYTNCSFYNQGADGIRITAASNTIPILVADCIFSTCLYGINNQTGSTTAIIRRINNIFFQCTSGSEYGLGDTAGGTSADSMGSTFVGSDPFTNAPSDMTPSAGSVALASGTPGIFEKQVYGTSADRGAVQHPYSESSSVVIPSPPLINKGWDFVG